MTSISNFGGIQNFGIDFSSQSLLGNTTGKTLLGANSLESGDILDSYFGTNNSTKTNNFSQSSSLFGDASNTGGSSFLQSISNLYVSLLKMFQSLEGNTNNPDQYANTGNTDSGDILDLSQYSNLSAFTASNPPGGVTNTPEAKSTPIPTPTVAAAGAPVPENGNNNKVNTSDFSPEPQVGKLSDAETKAQAEKLVQHLMNDFGLTKNQASGVVGNLMHESAGLNANMNQYGFANGGGPGNPSSDMNQGYGWAQWSYGRKQEYLNFCDAQQPKLNPASPAANYAFLKHELQTSESGTIAALKATNSPEAAATTFRKVYERAENPVDSSRIAAANQVAGWVA